MLAVLGGSGWDQLPGFKTLSHWQEITPYGPLASAALVGELDGAGLVFLPRHGEAHRLPPHQINYRANLWALKHMGVRAVVAINAVGGIADHCGPGVLVCPDQLIDYTWGRAHTFFDDRVEHVHFDPPFDVGLRTELLQVAKATGVALADGGTYGCTQGPRLETAAEIRRLARDGCDLVGMTAMPEAALARELDLAYASVCISVNWAAGLCTTEITMQDILAVLEQCRLPVLKLVSGLARKGL